MRLSEFLLTEESFIDSARLAGDDFTFNFEDDIIDDLLDNMSLCFDI